MVAERLNKIAGYRIMLGYTQKELAQKLGITPQNYSYKERGRRNFTDREKKLLIDILRMANNNLTMEELFF